MKMVIDGYIGTRRSILDSLTYRHTQHAGYRKAYIQFSERLVILMLSLYLGKSKYLGSLYSSVCRSPPHHVGR